MVSPLSSPNLHGAWTHGRPLYNDVTEKPPTLDNPSARLSTVPSTGSRPRHSAQALQRDLIQSRDVVNLSRPDWAVLVFHGSIPVEVDIEVRVFDVSAMHPEHVEHFPPSFLLASVAVTIPQSQVPPQELQCPALIVQLDPLAASVLSACLADLG